MGAATGRRDFRMEAACAAFVTHCHAFSGRHDAGFYVPAVLAGGVALTLN